MEFLNEKAITFIPNQEDEEKALSKTTHLCFAAHQDDIEIMAYSAIIECYNKKNKWFMGVNVADGAGSPRTGKFANFTNEEMMIERIKEQNKASEIGKYSAQIQLMYPSSKIKDASNENIVEDIKKIILKTKPEIIYTHNLMDKHSTHVAVAIKVIEALRQLKDVFQPKKVIGLEVWRGLDWLDESKKLCMDTTKNKKLALDLLKVYESQIAGGKRYDLATIGRRLANATFYESHSTDEIKSMNYGIDLTEFVYSNLSYEKFIENIVDDFKNTLLTQIKNLT